jgi:drug/metabolite transporter (DMT)-like permease
MATLIKQASPRYPVGELVFFRSFFALVPVLIWTVWRGEFLTSLTTPRVGRHFIRSLTGAITMFFGFSALAMLPIADATAIGYASPLITVVLAVIFLGEKVRIYRWSAVGIGLVGVLIMISDYVAPSGGPERSAIGAIVALIGAFLGAVSTIQVRALVRYEPAATIVIYFSGFTSLVALCTLPFGWSVPNPLDATMLVTAGILGGLGQVLMTQSFRHGDASLVAPFDYTSMIWALLVSWLVFHTWPSNVMLVGTAVVIAAGLFVIYREHRLGIERTRSKQAQTPSTPLS